MGELISYFMDVQSHLAATKSIALTKHLKTCSLNLNNNQITLNKVKLSFCGIFQSAVFANRIVNISLWALESEDLAALLQQNCSLDSFRLFKRRSETAGKLKRNV